MMKSTYKICMLGFSKEFFAFDFDASGECVKGIVSNASAGNSLVTMYAKCENCLKGFKLFILGMEFVLVRTIGDVKEGILDF